MKTTKEKPWTMPKDAPTRCCIIVMSNAAHNSKWESCPQCGTEWVRGRGDWKRPKWEWLPDDQALWVAAIEIAAEVLGDLEDDLFYGEWSNSILFPD
jgi:hypothetical protein